MFGLAASIEVAEVHAARAAIAETMARLRDTPVSADTLQRARQPMVEAQDNALKSNRGWMALTARAQSEANRIERFQKAKERLLALSPADVQAIARRYLGAKDAVEVLVLPEGVEVPAGTP